MKVYSSPVLSVAWLPGVDGGPPRLLGGWVVEDDDGWLWAVANVAGRGWRKRFEWKGNRPTEYLRWTDDMARLILCLLGVPGCELGDDERAWLTADAWGEVAWGLATNKPELGLTGLGRRQEAAS